MLTEIGPYKGNIFQIIAGQVVFGMALVFAILAAAHPPISYLLWCICFLLLIGNLAYFRYLNRMPFWVVTDEETGTMEIKYLLQKPRLLRKEEIIAYSDKNAGAGRAGDDGPGIYLHLSGNEKIAFTDFNMDNYAPIIIFLDHLKIKKLGDSK